MARKLRTYQTSLGFYDLAIAAPSMKAALEAWGAGSNLFHQGVAKEVDDPDVVDATMAKPGVVLRRRRDPAGASLNTPIYPPISTARGETGRAARRRSERCRTSVKKLHGKRPWTSKKNRSVEKLNVGARKLPGRWNANGATRAVAKAQAALDKARRDHEAKTGAIEADRASVEKRAQEDEARWNNQREKLEAALRRARE